VTWFSDALAAAATKIAEHGVDTLAVRTDVSSEASVQELAQSTIDRFGAVHVVRNTTRPPGWP
jgi:NAD(P)-dependent dehydrogenase (short-subunit alcohol dehydrogenase family)